MFTSRSMEHYNAAFHFHHLSALSVSSEYFFMRVATVSASLTPSPAPREANSCSRDMPPTPLADFMHLILLLSLYGAIHLYRKLSNAYYRMERPHKTMFPGFQIAKLLYFGTCPFHFGPARYSVGWQAGAVGPRARAAWGMRAFCSIVWRNTLFPRYLWMSTRYQSSYTEETCSPLILIPTKMSNNCRVKN